MARPVGGEEPVVEALFMLGLLAEERGTDAAGLALWRPDRPAAEAGSFAVQ